MTSNLPEFKASGTGKLRFCFPVEVSIYKKKSLVVELIYIILFINWQERERSG